MLDVTSDGCDRNRALRADAQRNRQRILDAARELFAMRGLEATLNDVAHHANVGVGTVYRRFATKDELIEAIFEDSIEQVVELAKAAVTMDDSWDAFVWFVEQLCERTATDRGLREMVCSKVYGGYRVECARLQLHPHIIQVVERARNDGHLRPEVASTDIPILNMLAGTVTEYAGHIEPDLWRRYIALMLEGMRCRTEQHRIEVDALGEQQIDQAMQGWQPAG